MRIQPHQSKQGINQILVTQKYYNQQFIILVFISQIEVFTINIRSFKIVRRRLYISPFQIIHSSLIKYKLYISMFNTTLAVIQLNKDCEITKKCLSMTRIIDSSQFITKTIQNNKQLISFRQIIRFVQTTSQQSKLWQTANGHLMKGNQIIGGQFMEQLNMSNSIEEFNYRQHNQFFPIKYYLSNCYNYLVGCQYAKSAEGLNNIRSKYGNWAEIFKINYKPEINPYWNCYQQSQKNFRKDLSGNKIKLIKKKTESILIAYYNCQNNSIMVSQINVDYSYKKKQQTILQINQNVESIIQTKTKYNSQEKVILSLKNVKRRVSEIRWIGLNQLLYIQESEYLYYLQFQFSYLQKKFDID